MTPSPGEWVTESIELVAPIAEGAMGKVWVAYHHRLRTRVAVKFVHERVTGDDAREALARFEQEAAMAAQIKCPHVVQTYDSGVSNEGTPYIVMELLEGQSLGDRLRTLGPLGWNEATTVVAQVARALTKAHELGIVHRDVKPDNIYLCRSDEGIFCKVLDFGIAKQTRLPAMGGLTTDGKIVGTPEYMSPEQVLEDKPVDYRADLWALAVVMYVSLTGRVPFEAKTLGQLCLNLVNRKPPPPSTLRPGLPAGADAWFARALNRDPAVRFGSARDLAVSFATAFDAAASHPELQSPTLLPSTQPLAPSEFPAAADLSSLAGFPSFPPPAETPTRLMRRRLRPVVALLALLGVALVVGAVAVLAKGSSSPSGQAAQATAPPSTAGTPRGEFDSKDAAPDADPVGSITPEPADEAPSTDTAASEETEPASPPPPATEPRRAFTPPAAPPKPEPPPAPPSKPSNEKSGRDLGF